MTAAAITVATAAWSSDAAAGSSTIAASSAPIASASLIVSLILRLLSATVSATTLPPAASRSWIAVSSAFLSRSPSLNGTASSTGSLFLMRTICGSGFVFTQTTMSTSSPLSRDALRAAAVVGLRSLPRPQLIRYWTPNCERG